jgi:DNA-binding GntR family transcriptional regulator
MLVEAPPSASLSARAYQVILHRILQGAVPVGGELSRRRLAAELGMSILPVAEALQRLQNEGIVETQSRVGTRVRVPTPADVHERYEVREALESQTARLFCRMATEADRAELRRHAEQIDLLYNRYFEGAETDPEFLYSVQETHAVFHRQIAQVGGCKALRRMIETNQVLTFNWLYHVAAACPVLPADFHSQLAQALCTQDEEAADRAMRAHVRYGVEQIISRLSVNFSAAAAR